MTDKRLATAAEVEKEMEAARLLHPSADIDSKHSCFTKEDLRLAEFEAKKVAELWEEEQKG